MCHVLEERALFLPRINTGKFPVLFMNSNHSLVNMHLLEMKTVEREQANDWC